jgi:hypothetical protein
MEQNIQIKEVNANEEIEIVEKNCLDCEFLKLHPQGKMFCFRRKKEGVIVEISDIYMATLPCPARDAIGWDEEMDSEGNFRVDKELGYGYWAYMKKLNDGRIGD